MLRDPVALLGAATLTIVAAVFAEWALRLRRSDAVAARVALIAPWTHAAAAAPARAPEAAEEPLRGTQLDPAKREIALRLRRLGVPARFAPFAMLAARPLAALALGIGVWFLGPHLITAWTSPLLRMLLAGSAGILGWFLPMIVARRSAKRRAAVVVAGLPDALELLVICAEGGLGLAEGIDRIVTELKRSQPELADELAITAADLKILPTQDQALARLAERIDVPIVRSVVTSLSQTMRYGTPIAQAMRVVAAELRNESLIRMEERANQLPALLTIPMILFILPTIFLIVGGPAALRITDMFLR